MAQKVLQVRNQKTLEMIVGIPVAWTSKELRDEAESALAVRRDSQERGLSQQVRLQENHLRSLAFLNRLAGLAISAKPLEGNFEAQSLGAELMPPLAMKILHAMETMPHPVEIEEWRILKPAPKRVERLVRYRDPYLAFKVAGRWYSVCEWK